MPWDFPAMDLLWRNAWTVIPLTVAVALACRFLPTRCATRHTLWLVALLGFLAPAFTPARTPPQWLSSLFVPAAASADDAPGLVRTLAPPTIPPVVTIAPAGDSDDLSDEPAAILASRPDHEIFERPLMRRAETARRMSRGDAASGAHLPDSSSAFNATSPRAGARTWPDSPAQLPAATGSAGAIFSSSALPSIEPDARPARPPAAPASAPHGAPAPRDGRRPDPPSKRTPTELEAKPRAPRAPPPAARRLAAEPPSARRSGAAPALASLPDEAPKDFGADRESLLEQDKRNEAAAASARPQAAAPGGEWRRSWAVALTALRDAIFSVPAPTARVWACIVALWLLTQGFGLARFRRRLSRSLPAPAHVRRTVDALAKSLGVQAPPETVMLDARVSPMVWCGRRPTLVLPTRLWAQLDRTARRAILCHELAHIRRRDHWVRWIEMLVSSLFWWHPALWLIRRRIDQEADLCCDSWVTWLLPQGRRAYAEAILRTRQFLGDGRAARPSAGMGVMTVGARTLARRLTMVMTQSSRPWTSVSGLALAALIASAGWVVAPAWSCPPECDQKSDKHKSKAAPLVVAAPDAEAPTFMAFVHRPGERAGDVYVTPDAPAPGLFFAPPGAGVFVAPPATPHAPHPPHPPAPPAAPAPPAPPMFAYAYGGATLLGGDDDEALEQKLNRLEEQLRRLTEELRELREMNRGGGRERETRARAEQRGAEARGRGDARAAEARERAGQRAAEAGERELEARQRDAEARERAAARGGQSGGFWSQSAEGGLSWRTYKLPKNKLEKLTALMARDDVPVLVRPGDDSIEVQGTERQHRIFAAFVGLLEKETADREYELSKGKLDALTELMSLDDVPILVRPGDEALGVRATDYQHRVFDAFVNMIEGREGAGAASIGWDAGAAAGPMSVYRLGRGDYAKALDYLGQLKALDSKLDGSAAQGALKELLALGKLGAVRALPGVTDWLEAHADQIEKYSTSLEAQAEAIAAQAEQMAERLRGAAGAKWKDQARAVETNVKALLEQARTLERQARELQRAADKARQEAEKQEQADEDGGRLLLIAPQPTPEPDVALAAEPVVVVHPQPTPAAAPVAQR